MAPSSESRLSRPFQWLHSAVFLTLCNRGRLLYQVRDRKFGKG